MTTYSKEYGATWRAKNRESIRAYHKAWRARNTPISVAEYGRQLARSRKWKQQPGYYVQYSAKIRALKRAASCGCCAPISFKFIYLQAQGLKMEVDHVQPLSKGGKHCLRNLQLLDPIENRRKGARWLEAA